MNYVNRSIHQRLWHSSLFETLSAAERGVYLYLTTGPATSILGVVEATRRRLAFDAAVSEAELDRILAKLEAAGELLVDGDTLWLPAFIRRQCTASPKMLAALRAQLASVESDTIRKAICAAYPSIMNPRPVAGGYRIHTVSEPSRSDLIIGLKTDRADAAPVDGAPAGNLEADGSGPLTVSPEVEAQLRRQFPGVDYDATLARIRGYLERTGKSVRNVLRYLTACFSSAATSEAAAAPKPSPVPVAYKKPEPAPSVKNRLTLDPFRTPTPEELEENARRGLAMLARRRLSQSEPRPGQEDRDAIRPLRAAFQPHALLEGCCV